MKNPLIKNLLTAAIAVSAVAVTSQSFADDQFYVGIGASQAFVDERGLDDDDTGGKVFAGYNFNDYFAVEASYYDFGDTEQGANRLAVDGFGIAAVGKLPVSDSVSLFAKVGAHDWDAEANGPIATRLSDDSDSDVFYGVGVQYDLGFNLSLRGEVERYEVDDFDFDVATIGISYNF